MTTETLISCKAGLARVPTVTRGIAISAFPTGQRFKYIRSTLALAQGDPVNSLQQMYQPLRSDFPMS